MGNAFGGGLLAAFNFCSPFGSARSMHFRCSCKGVPTAWVSLCACRSIIAYRNDMAVSCRHDRRQCLRVFDWTLPYVAPVEMLSSWHAYKKGATFVHLCIAVICCIVVFVAHPFNAEVVTDWAKALIVLLLISFMCELSMRNDFETRHRLRKFRQQLDTVVAQLSNGGQGHGQSQNAQAAANATKTMAARYSGTKSEDQGYFADVDDPVIGRALSPGVTSSRKRTHRSSKTIRRLVSSVCESTPYVREDLVAAVCKSLQRAQDINRYDSMGLH